MNNAIAALPAVLRERARVLEPHGSSGLAWSATDASRVLQSIENTNVVVLGGDVLREAEGGLVFNYDNWSCDRYGPLEDLHEYAARSRQRAKEYIEAYPPGDFFFRLVLTDEPTAGLTKL